MKKLLKEFKDFINRGNVVDMAVGVMFGAALKAIVDSLVKDMISPIVGLIFRQNFDNLSITIPFFNVTFGIGSFIMAIINFLIIAVILFAIVKLMNMLRNIKIRGSKDEEVPAPTTKVCPYCKSEIAIDATRCPHCTSELEKELENA